MGLLETQFAGRRGYTDMDWMQAGMGQLERGFGGRGDYADLKVWGFWKVGLKVGEDFSVTAEVRKALQIMLHTKI
jgi:hypothetical protein